MTLPIALALTTVLRDSSWVRPSWRRHLGLYGGLGAIAGVVLLARARCLGRWIGAYPGGPAPADPVAMLGGVPKLLYYLVVPAPWPAGPGAAWLPLVGAAVGGLLLLTLRRGDSIGRTAWAAAVTGCLALPILALVGTLARPTDLGRILVLPTVGFALVLGSGAARLRRPAKRVGLWAVLLVWLGLLAHYQAPLVTWARLTRHILVQVERVAREPDVSTVLVVGLPPWVFGPDNWAFSRAAAPPFIELPATVTVRLVPAPPTGLTGHTRVLAWRSDRGVVDRWAP